MDINGDGEDEGDGDGDDEDEDEDEDLKEVKKFLLTSRGEESKEKGW